MPRLLFLLAWALLALAANAQAPDKPLRILFIGNALGEKAQVPGRLDKLARAMGKPATVEALASPGHSLHDHLREGRAAAEIAKGWDVVVLQQGPSARDPERTQLKEAGRELAALARKAGARPAFLMVWPRSDRLGEFRDVIAAYRDAAEASQATLLPVGEAWLRALGAERRLRLYADASHSAALGSDLAVLTAYLALFPAGPREFDESFVARIARALEMRPDYRDLLFDAATRAIDEPMALK